MYATRSPELRSPASVEVLGKASDTALNVSKSVLNGFADGIHSMAHTIAHPIDSVIYPVATSVYDAAIISSSIDPTSELHSLVKNNPTLYKSSHDRMKNRIDTVKRNLIDFKDASAIDKIRVASSLATTTIVPGTVLRGITNLSSKLKYGSSNPPRFHNNNYSDIATNPLPKIKLYTAKDVKAVPGREKFIYAIDTKGKLNVAKEAHPGIWIKGETEFMSYKLAHPELASLQPVLAAGEFFTKDGIITKINTKSGHYRPYDVSGKGNLRTTIENAFVKEGFDARCKYISYNILISTTAQGSLPLSLFLSDLWPVVHGVSNLQESTTRGGRRRRITHLVPTC